METKSAQWVNFWGLNVKLRTILEGLAISPWGSSAGEISLNLEVNYTKDPHYRLYQQRASFHTTGVLRPSSSLRHKMTKGQPRALLLIHLDLYWRFAMNLLSIRTFSSKLSNSNFTSNFSHLIHPMVEILANSFFKTSILIKHLIRERENKKRRRGLQDQFFSEKHDTLKVWNEVVPWTCWLGD